MSADDQKNLFKAGHKGKGKKSSDLKMSHGLGLHICQEIAKAMGGNLKYLKPTKGASFMLALNLKIVEKTRVPIR